MNTEDERPVRREQAGDRSVEYETSKETRDEGEREEKRAAKRAKGQRFKVRLTD